MKTIFIFLKWQLCVFLLFNVERWSKREKDKQNAFNECQNKWDGDQEKLFFLTCNLITNFKDDKISFKPVFLNRWAAAL